MKNTSVWFLAFALVTATGCAPTTPQEKTAKSEDALLAEGSCSDDLGKDYLACQAELPTPREQCFIDAQEKFYRCLATPALAN